MMCKTQTTDGCPYGHALDGYSRVQNLPISFAANIRFGTHSVSSVEKATKFYCQQILNEVGTF